MPPDPTFSSHPIPGRNGQEAVEMFRLCELYCDREVYTDDYFQLIAAPMEEDMVGSWVRLFVKQKVLYGNGPIFGWL